MRPTEAVFRLGGACARHIPGPGADVLLFAGQVVETRERAIVTAPIRDVDISRLRCDERALAERNGMPLARTDTRSDNSTRPFERTLVLRGSEYVERKLVVERDVIVLPGRLIALAAP